MDLNVHNIYHLNQEKLFTEDEAYELVNLLHAVTPKSKNKVNSLNSQLETFKHDTHKLDEIQNELNDHIHRWSEKIRRLGGIPVSLWKVRIPSEKGYYMWEFPKAELEFFN